MYDVGLLCDTAKQENLNIQSGTTAKSRNA